MSSESSFLKRKCKSPEDKKFKFKRRLINSQKSSLHILDFSDCILLEILKHLDATSLFHLSLTCQRLSCLVEDQTLWVYIDGRSRPNTAAKTEFCWSHVTNKTKHLHLAGDYRSQFILSARNMLTSEAIQNLTVLSLEHQYIKYVKLSDFPQSLEEISFRSSFVARHKAFFRFSEKAMCNLRTLILDHCQWFDSNNFTPICKYPKLEILSLYMCKKLGDDDIANVSVASRFGFNSLKVIDARFTGVGNHFLECFCSKSNIQIIYFQCISTTYYLERYQRQLDILNGASKSDNSYISDEESHNSTPESLKKRFNACNLQKYDSQSITDSSIMSFNKLGPAPNSSPRPRSVLYKYPYSHCTCNRSKVQNQAFPEKVELPNEKPEAHELCEKLERERSRQAHARSAKIRSDMCFFFPNTANVCFDIASDCFIPTWLNKEATPAFPLQDWLYARSPRNDYEISMYENADKYLHSHITHRCIRSSCMCQTQVFLEVHLQEDNNVIELLTNGIKKIKNATDRSREARELVLELFAALKIDNDKLEQGEAVQSDIAANLLELANHISYDIRSVMKYHLSCFSMLLYGLKRNQNVDLRTFFFNLSCSESRDKSFTDPKFEQPPVEPEPLPSSQEPLASIDANSSRVLVVDLAPEFANVREFPTRFVCVNLREAQVNKSITHIKEISFRGCILITDNALLYLRHLELDLLDVTGTNVTSSGVAEFMLYNPQCWVIHESVCTCRPRLHF